LVAWNPQIFIFGWGEDFIMGISFDFKIAFAMCKSDFFEVILQ